MHPFAINILYITWGDEGFCSETNGVRCVTAISLKTALVFELRTRKSGFNSHFIITISFYNIESERSLQSCISFGRQRWLSFFSFCILCKLRCGKFKYESQDDYNIAPLVKSNPRYLCWQSHLNIFMDVHIHFYVHCVLLLLSFTLKLHELESKSNSTEYGVKLRRHSCLLMCIDVWGFKCH